MSPPMPYSTALRCAGFRSRRCRWQSIKGSAVFLVRSPDLRYHRRTRDAITTFGEMPGRSLRYADRLSERRPRLWNFSRRPANPTRFQPSLVAGFTQYFIEHLAQQIVARGSMATAILVLLHAPSGVLIWRSMGPDFMMS